jgi:hypothetical protein
MSERTTTLQYVRDSPVEVERVLAAGYDFSLRRTEVFPAVSERYLTVHDVEATTAEVTEGTRAGIGVNWERCRYDWSQPGVVVATVIDSNVYAFPGSRWELKATPTSNGSRVEMIWVRRFADTTRGRFWGFMFRRVGKRIFAHEVSRILRNLERVESA